MTEGELPTKIFRKNTRLDVLKHVLDRAEPIDLEKLGKNKPVPNQEKQTSKKPAIIKEMRWYADIPQEVIDAVAKAPLPESDTKYQELLPNGEKIKPSGIKLILDWEAYESIRQLARSWGAAGYEAMMAMWGRVLESDVVTCQYANIYPGAESTAVMVEVDDLRFIEREAEERLKAGYVLVGIPHVHPQGLGSSYWGRFSGKDFDSTTENSWRGEPGKSRYQLVLGGTITDDETWDKEISGFYAFNPNTGGTTFKGVQIQGSVERLVGFYIWTGNRLIFDHCYNPADPRQWESMDAILREKGVPKKFITSALPNEPQEKVPEQPTQELVYNPATRSYELKERPQVPTQTKSIRPENSRWH